MSELTDEQRRAALKKWRRRAVIAGVVLAVACRSLPKDYQVPCRALASLCSSDFSALSSFSFPSFSNIDTEGHTP